MSYQQPGYQQPGYPVARRSGGTLVVVGVLLVLVGKRGLVHAHDRARRARP